VKKAPTAANGAATPIADVMSLAQGLSETTHMADAKAFIGWLDKQPSVATNRKVGTQGYCMGGPIAFRTAAAVPTRVGAVASFHGGGLVTTQPNSPHVQSPGPPFRSPGLSFRSPGPSLRSPGPSGPGQTIASTAR
jgi:carboxymethylenebutenolidase